MVAITTDTMRMMVTIVMGATTTNIMRMAVIMVMSVTIIVPISIDEEEWNQGKMFPTH